MARDEDLDTHSPVYAFACRVHGAPQWGAKPARRAPSRSSSASPVIAAMPDVRCGQRVRVGDAEGTIVGHNDSANFDVLFDAGSRYGANVLNVHPGEMTLL